MLKNSFTVLNELVHINHKHDETVISSHMKDIAKHEEGGVFSAYGNDVSRIFHKHIKPEQASDAAQIIYDTVENWATIVEYYPGFKSLSAANNVLFARTLMQLNFRMLDNGLYDYNLLGDSCLMIGDYAADDGLYNLVLQLDDLELCLDLRESRFKNMAWRKVKDYWVFVWSETLISSNVHVDALAEAFNVLEADKHGGDVWLSIDVAAWESTHQVEISVVHDLNLHVAGSGGKYLK